ncbi:MAG TPA: DUF5686 family protein [Bacteroidia bacterium]|jgi:hypothetical protein|nr:DUF5686 family protein [Bacteroidia bacterium]
MRIYRLLVTSIFILFAIQQGYAQLTKVYGTVTDQVSKKNIPFVSISFKGTNSIGSSNKSGAYAVQSKTPCDSLIFALTGYIKKTVFIQRNKEQRLDITLEKINYSLKEIVVTNTKETVTTIIDSVLAHKNSHNNKLLKSYAWERYDKFQIYFGKYSAKIKELKPFKEYNYLFNYTDTANGQALLPIYMSESIFKKYVDDSSSINDEVLIARKSTGENYENLTTMTDKFIDNVNIYEDYFQIVDKSFVSPLIDNSQLFYKYHLDGGFNFEKKGYYKISFSPKWKEDFTFTGYFLVDLKTWAIKKIIMHVSENINLNYIKTFTIQQEYTQTDKVWVINRQETWVTLSVLKWQKKEDLTIHRLTSYKDIILNKPDIILKDYKAVKENKTYGKEITSEDFWKRSRHQPLRKKEKYNYAIADTINQVPFIQKAKRVGTIVISGYMELGKVSLHHLNTFYSINPIEDHRFKFGLITNKYFSEKLQLQGYVAYGLRDQEIKYKGGILYVLNKKTDRLLLGGSYKYDLEQIGTSPSHISFDNVVTTFSKINRKIKLTFVSEAIVYMEKEWTKGVVSKLSVLNKQIRPLGDIRFEKIVNENVLSVHDITISELQINSRFSFEENFYINEFKRISLGTRYPVLITDIAFGFKNLLGADYSYQRVKTNIVGKFHINPVGYIYYNLEGGKIFGTIPFPLTEIHPANQTLAYDVEGFNVMRYFEFASDEYVSLHLDHHFDGFFFNKIPYVKKAKLREVISARGVMGKLSMRNQLEMNLPEGMSAVSKPYLEYSVGIENIFKVLRIEYIWRGTHFSPVSKRDNWGIKARFFLTF